jgi:hypothetical protein
MAEQLPYPNEKSPQANSSDTSQNPLPAETAIQKATPLETAIIQATPEAVQSPSWFNGAVKKIADAWFDPKSFESPEVYEKLGVRTFKKYLPTSGDLIRRLVWKRFGDEAWVKHGDIQSLKHMEKFTRVFEGVHLAGVGVFSAAIGWELAQGDIKGAVAATAINTVYSVYSIMLQRYNRLRLYRAINRLEERHPPQNQIETVSSFPVEEHQQAEQ